MRILDLISDLVDPTPEQVKAGMMRQIERIRWAFNGDDIDCFAVKVAVDTIEFYVNAVPDQTDSVRCSNLVSNAVEPLGPLCIDMLRNLENLAVVRITGQGRWFSDKDGPDYVPPSASNPTDN